MQEHQMASSQQSRQAESNATPSCGIPIQTAAATGTGPLSASLQSPHMGFIYPPSHPYSSPPIYPFPIAYQSPNRLPGNSGLPHMYHPTMAAVPPVTCSRPEMNPCVPRAPLSPSLPIRYLPMPMFYHNMPLSQDFYHMNPVNLSDGGNYFLSPGGVPHPLLQFPQRYPIPTTCPPLSRSQHEASMCESPSMNVGVHASQSSTPITSLTTPSTVDDAGNKNFVDALSPGSVVSMRQREETSIPVKQRQQLPLLLSNLSSSSSSYLTPKSTLSNLSDYHIYHQHHFHTPIHRLQSVEGSSTSKGRERANSIGFEEPEILTAKNDSEDAHYMSDEEDGCLFIKGEEEFLDLADDNEKVGLHYFQAQPSSSIRSFLSVEEPCAHMPFVNKEENTDQGLPIIDFDPRILQRLTPEELHKLMSYRQAIMNLLVRSSFESMPPSDTVAHMQREPNVPPSTQFLICDDKMKVQSQKTLEKMTSPLISAPYQAFSPTSIYNLHFMPTVVENSDPSVLPVPVSTIDNTTAQVSVDTPKKVGRFQIQSVTQQVESDLRDTSPLPSSILASEGLNIVLEKEASCDNLKELNPRSYDKAERTSRFRRARIEECWEAWETSGLAVCDWRSKKTDNKLIGLIPQNVDDAVNDASVRIDCQLCQSSENIHEEQWKCLHKADFTPYLDTNYLHKTNIWNQGHRQVLSSEQQVLETYDLQEKEKGMMRKTNSVSESLSSSFSQSSKECRDIGPFLNIRKTIPSPRCACCRSYHCHECVCCPPSAHTEIDHLLDTQGTYFRHRSHNVPCQHKCRHYHSASSTPFRTHRNYSSISPVPEVGEKKKSKDNYFLKPPYFRNQNNRSHNEHISHETAQQQTPSKTHKGAHVNQNCAPPGTPSGKDLTRELIHEQFLNRIHCNLEGMLTNSSLEQQRQLVEKAEQTVLLDLKEICEQNEAEENFNSNGTNNCSTTLNNSIMVDMVTIEDPSLHHMHQVEKRITQHLEESKACLIHFFREEIHKANVHINYLLEQNRLQQQCFHNLFLAIRQHVPLNEDSLIPGEWIPDCYHECQCASFQSKLDQGGVSFMSNPQFYEGDANLSKFC